MMTREEKCTNQPFRAETRRLCFKASSQLPSTILTGTILTRGTILGICQRVHENAYVYIWCSSVRR